MNTARAEDNLIGAFYPRKLAADATDDPLAGPELKALSGELKLVKTPTP